MTLYRIGSPCGGMLVEGNRELAVRLALERTGSSFAHCFALFEISVGENNETQDRHPHPSVGTAIGKHYPFP